jgi:putative glycerol-1-phosphate prenyltransferase
MQKNTILHSFYQLKTTNSKAVAVLLDPDFDNSNLLKLLQTQNYLDAISYFFVGGSLVDGNSSDELIQSIKDITDKPVIAFPGSILQIDYRVDGLLFLQLISGRNPEYLIGHHIIAAPYLKKMNIEVISTGYMLVDCGAQTTASYISNTTPIPYNKANIAAVTSMAGEMLGLKVMYLDGGSGADKPISPQMIQAVRSSVDCPIIVGGGITTLQQIKDAHHAGADVVVIGTAIEKNPTFLSELSVFKQIANN